MVTDLERMDIGALFELWEQLEGAREICRDALGLAPAEQQALGHWWSEQLRLVERDLDAVRTEITRRKVIADTEGVSP